MLPDIPREELDLLKRASALLSNAEERLLLLAEDMTRQAVGLRAMVVSGEVTEEEAEAELRAWRDGIAESEEAMAFEAARVQALHAAQVVAEQLSRKGKTPYEVRRYIVEMPKALVAAPPAPGRGAGVRCGGGHVAAAAFAGRRQRRGASDDAGEGAEGQAPAGPRRGEGSGDALARSRPLALAGARPRPGP